MAIWGYISSSNELSISVVVPKKETKHVSLLYGNVKIDADNS